MARSLAAVLAAVSFLVLVMPAAVEAAVPVPALPPAWTELTPDQKQTLAPLASEWDQLEVYRRKKWLGIAQRYATLSPDEQARVQRRMRDWVKLSPEERKAAREKYKSLQKASPEHKEVLKQKWQEYKDLPEEEKLRFQQQPVKTKPQPRPGRSAKPLVPVLPPATPAPTPTESAAAPGSGEQPAAAPAPAAQ